MSASRVRQNSNGAWESTSSMVNLSFGDGQTNGGDPGTINEKNDEFFDIAGRADVVANSILGVSKDGFSITSKQIANSKYYTQATKNTTRAFANNLKSMLELQRVLPVKPVS